MGFSFRRSVRLFPGVSLNLSARGFSTTVGTRGATFTTGTRGSRVHLGLPGTGLSFDHTFSSGRSPRSPRLPVPAEASWPTLPAPTPAPLPLPEAPGSAPAGEIRSQGNDAITSLTLVELRNLLAEAYAESRRLRGELPAADAEVRRTQGRADRWTNGILLKHLLKRRYQSIVQESEATRAERLALGQEIERCRIALEIELEGGIETSYGALVDAFRVLAGCDRCWDTTSEVAVDQFRQRTLASKAISRRPVTLDLKAAEVVAPSRPVLHLQNRNGGDLFLLPGFLLVFGDHRDFALIQLNEVKLESSIVRFHEEESVPADSKLLGHTWAKTNKDGSRDKRFANNYQIPILEYGELTFSSAAGLNERYLFSSAPKTAAFARAFGQHRATLPV